MKCKLLELCIESGCYNNEARGVKGIQPGYKKGKLSDLFVCCIAFCKKAKHPIIGTGPGSFDYEFSASLTFICGFCTGPIVRKGCAYSVDRMNPDLCYSKSNCISCCAICNDMKGALPMAAFLAKCHAIALHLSGE